MNRPAPRVRTAAGIEIGGAYIAPPPPPSLDAEAIQRALLRHSRNHILGSGGAMRKAQARHRPRVVVAPARPSLIPLDNSLIARALRALRWVLRLRGPRP